MACLIALHLLAEYGLYVLIRYDTLTVAIVNQFQAVYDGPAANLMGIVLVACAVGVLALEAWLRGDRRYARVGSGSARTAPAGQGSAARAALDAAAHRHHHPRRRPAPGDPDPLDADRRPRRLAPRRSSPRPSASPSFYAVLGAVFVCARGAAHRLDVGPRPGPLQRALENMHLYVGALPGVIVALALVAITVRVALPLYQTVATHAHRLSCCCSCRAPSSRCAPASRQVPVELQHAAIALGRPPLRAAIGTTLRLAFPGIGAGMALVAMGIMTELDRHADAVAHRHRDAGDASSGPAPASSTTWAPPPSRWPWLSLSVPLCVILHRQATGAR